MLVCGSRRVVRKSRVAEVALELAAAAATSINGRGLDLEIRGASAAFASNFVDGGPQVLACGRST